MKYNQLSQVKGFIGQQLKAWDQINELVKHVQAMAEKNPGIALPDQDKMQALTEMERIERGACEAIQALITCCEPGLKAEHDVNSKAEAEKRKAEAKSKPSKDASKDELISKPQKKQEPAKPTADPGFIDLFAEAEGEAS